jgi:predicted nucleic acid-binding protein
MMHGLDTGFFVAAEVAEHAEHADARATLARLVSAGDRIAIAPQVLAEFIHTVTDPRRFTHPLDMGSACQLAEQWWTAADVQQVFPDDAATRQFLLWLGQFGLGRKRLLDTQLAATYRQAVVLSLLTNNPADFSIFGTFTCITPKAAPTTPGRFQHLRDLHVHHTEGGSYDAMNVVVISRAFTKRIPRSHVVGYHLTWTTPSPRGSRNAS